MDSDIRNVGVCLSGEIVTAGIIKILERDMDSMRIHTINNPDNSLVANLDILILDVRSSGFGLLEKSFRQYPQIKIIVVLPSGRLSASLFPTLIAEPNVWAALSQDLPGVLWRKSVKTVASGKKYFTDAQKEWLANEVTARKKNACQTPREMEIIHLIKNDHSLKEIAERLNLSQKTIGTYVFRLRKKYQIKNLALLEI